MDRNEALKLVKSMLRTIDEQEALRTLIPDLKESEDERIRRSLVDYFRQFNPEDKWDEEFLFKDVLAYLENQKENPWSEEDEAIVKTMCKEGDLKPSERAWLMNLKNRISKDSLHISEMCKENADSFADISEDKKIIRVIGLALTDVPEERFASLGTTLKDCLSYLEKQKEQSKEELVYRLNGLMQDYVKEGKDEAEKEHRLKCYRLFWDALEDASYFEQKEQKPVARENDFVSKPKTSLEILKHYLIWAENSEEDCPYTWKELAAAIKDAIAALEQKLAEWGEEDETYFQDALWCIEQAEKVAKDEGDMGACWSARRWLKSLPERFNLPLKQEWSEEDRTMAFTLMRDIEQVSFISKEGKNKRIAWLNNLPNNINPQPHWKPSEEQMNVLRKLFINGVNELTQTDYNLLNSIYLNLKKLM